MNERGVEYSVLGRVRWSLGWDEILAVQAYARPEGAYRVGFRIESSGRDADLNTRDDLLSKQDIIVAFCSVGAAARRRAIEVGDPLGWLPEPDQGQSAKGTSFGAAAGRGKWYLSREPRHLLAASVAGAAFAILLAMGVLYPGFVPFAGGLEELAVTVLIVGIATAIAVPAMSADAIAALRLTRHGVGLRLASRREIVVRWTDVESVESSPGEGILVIATNDARRRAARLQRAECSEIVEWLGANDLCVMTVDGSSAVLIAPPAASSHSSIAPANSSDIS